MNNPIKAAQEKADRELQHEYYLKEYLHARDRAIIAAVADIAENMRDVYDDDVDNRNDKYRIEGYNKALKEIITRLNV